MKAKEKREAAKAAAEQKKIEEQENINYVIKMIKEEKEKEHIEKNHVVHFRNELDKFEDAVKDGLHSDLDKAGFKELRKFSFSNPDAIGVEFDRLKKLYETEEQIFSKLLEIVQLFKD